MKLKQTVNRILSSNIKNKISRFKHNNELKSVQCIECDANNLRTRKDLFLENIFYDDRIEHLWNKSKAGIDKMSMPHGTGGVNAGDRKAIYYLICKLEPASVLEIGTHIGASTVHIAAALYMSRIRLGINAQFTSVDMVDVNSHETKPWLNYGSKHSPAEMINKLNYGSFVNFAVDTSLNYAANCTEKYDFIFLDGSHAASIVYQEIPMFLKLLNPDGLILLHGYFPSLKPLWSKGTIIPGPYLATERLVKEGVNLDILPLGNLPWPTKQRSNATSLALLLRGMMGLYIQFSLWQ